MTTTRSARGAPTTGLRAIAAVGLLALALAACGEPQLRSSAKRHEGREGSASAVQTLAAGDGSSAATGAASSGRVRSARASVGRANPGTTAAADLRLPDGSAPTFGVTDEAISVVYYWKGDRTRTSPFLRGTGTESNVDEAEAFRTWIDYINAHPRGEIMGYRYDLHGRELAGTVVEAGQSAEEQAATAERIASELKPFAALAAHGSVSAYACPFLAAGGIINLATYDLDHALYDRTNGYCLPSAATFDDQVTVMERYLSERVAKTRSTGGQQRRIGLLYAEYPGLVDSAPRLAERFKRAGIPVVSVASVSDSLTEGQQQAAGVVAKFSGDRVNTVVMPDAGAPLSFTHAAEAQGFRPDYVIWPCSGQDVPAMVRLFSAPQWARASGLTCYDAEFMHDLNHEGPSEGTEWYAKYRSVGRGEPPAQAPFLYLNILPLLVGVTEAGPDLTTDRFRRGLANFAPQRYSAVRGRTSEPSSMLLTLDRPGRPLLGDFTVLDWSNTARRDGATLTGAYGFPEGGRRYPARGGF